MWQAEIGSAQRERSLGTHCYHFCGQANSPFEAGRELTKQVITGDLIHLVVKLKIVRLVVVGLFIGGLYAAKSILAGLDVAGLVLINTLQKSGLRLDWINTGTLRAM
jgi:hypothetical protein